MAEAPMGDQAKKAWNGWLEERDQAPGEAIAGWFKEKVGGSLEVAKELAQAGFNLAKSRADVIKAGSALLDSGGEPARECILMKQQVTQTLAADDAVIRALTYYSKHYREESAFQTDADVAVAFSRRGSLYAKALDVLGQPPEAVEMTPVERDAAAILQLRSAVGRPLSLGGSGADGASALAALLGGGGGSSSSSAPASASDTHFEKLLKELFRLHDLNGDGAIGERELIKLNQKIAMLHYGKGADKDAVRAKFSKIFRKNLDAEGRPVGYPAFREHTLKMLTQLDPSQPAQEMILEQFIAEAELAREAFHDAAFASFTDAEFLPHLLADRPKDAASRLPTIEASPVSKDEGSPGRTASFAKASEASKEAMSLMSTTSDNRSQGAPGSVDSGAYPSVASRVAAAVREQAVMSAKSSSIDALDSRPQASSCRSPPKEEKPAQSSTNSKARSSVPTSVSHDSEAPAESLRSREREASSRDAQVGDTASRERATCEGYATKDCIQVWSNSKKEWLDGVVVQAFPEDCEAQGYSVPKGTLKVSSSAGTKWVRPGQAASMLRFGPSSK